MDVTSTRGLLGDQETLGFFTGVAANLGRAATAAGLARTVTLSIVGIEKSADYGYYVAKLAQEHVARESGPGALVLRADAVPRLRPADVRVEPRRRRHPGHRRADPARRHHRDRPPAPDLTTGTMVLDVELAGPRPERLVDLAERYAAHIGSAVTVEAIDGPPSLAAGAMLPDHDGVLLRGIDWQTWLEAQPTRP